MFDSPSPDGILGPWPRLGVVAVALMTVSVACSGGDDEGGATAALTEPDANAALGNE